MRLQPWSMGSKCSNYWVLLVVDSENAKTRHIISTLLVYLGLSLTPKLCLCLSSNTVRRKLVYRLLSAIVLLGPKNTVLLFNLLKTIRFGPGAQIYDYGSS